MRRILATLVLVAAAAACSTEPAPTGLTEVAATAPSRIVEVASGRSLDEAELVAELATADFVLIGGEPDNPLQHRLTAQLIRTLSAGSPRLAAVAFEVVRVDRQQALTEHLSRFPGTSRGLDAALDWSAGGWPAFELYRPALDAALATDATIVGANLSPGQVAGLTAEGYGVLPPSMVRRGGLDRPLSADTALSLSRALVERSCGRVSVEALAAMIRVERARDALIAERLVLVSGRGRGVLVASPLHVRDDWGVPAYIRRLVPGARVVSLAFRGDVEPPLEPGPPDLPYDYVWTTGSMHAPGFDPCAPGGREEDGLRTAALRP